MLKVANCAGKRKCHRTKETFPLVNLLRAQPRPSLDDRHSASVSPKAASGLLANPLKLVGRGGWVFLAHDKL